MIICAKMARSWQENGQGMERVWLGYGKDMARSADSAAILPTSSISYITFITYISMGINPQSFNFSNIRKTCTFVLQSLKVSYITSPAFCLLPLVHRDWAGQAKTPRPRAHQFLPSFLPFTFSFRLIRLVASSKLEDIVNVEPSFQTPSLKKPRCLRPGLFRETFSRKFWSL